MKAHKFKANSSGSSLHHGNPTFPFRSRRRITTQTSLAGYWSQPQRWCHYCESALVHNQKLHSFMYEIYQIDRDRDERSILYIYDMYLRVQILEAVINYSKLVVYHSHSPWTYAKLYGCCTANVVPWHSKPA